MALNTILQINCSYSTLQIIFLAKLLSMAAKNHRKKKNKKEKKIHTWLCIIIQKITKCYNAQHHSFLPIHFQSYLFTSLSFKLNKLKDCVWVNTIACNFVCTILILSLSLSLSLPHFCIDKKNIEQYSLGFYLYIECVRDKDHATKFFSINF